ncbi:hypothetical protein H1P_3240012 [Hyella patelloides LEGE 07179]|uniref:Uncharacterized protein n=1 Tax=Hyella patelloides LEGE 07179 TaxID=945734 RepID=A0A563VV75_9CYAN|nr:hypothetical protein [Hyella patelloides]VEP15310.1 hypothetical protein H1P_3240012 [Hyella patelloides LEGE 07179]
MLKIDTKTASEHRHTILHNSRNTLGEINMRYRELLDTQKIKPSDFKQKLANLPESSLLEGYLILEPTHQKVLETVV